MTIKDDLAELCRLEARIGALTVRKKALRDALLEAGLKTLKEEGAAPTWRVPSFGTVGVTNPVPKPVVIDAAVLMAWLVERYGEDPVETIRRIRAGWLEGFWPFCSMVEATCAVVSGDGELIPGVVSQASGAPNLFVRLSKEAKLAAQIDLDMAALAETAVEEAS
jgi:hypothetical protein